MFIANVHYAHEDEALLKELIKHLSLLKRQGLISIWYNREIVPGTNWAKVIDQQLEQASIILLRVSADFLASDYCYEIEMKRALERHEAGLPSRIPHGVSFGKDATEGDSYGFYYVLDRKPRARQRVVYL
jgi:hypothetical protein